MANLKVKKYDPEKPAEQLKCYEISPKEYAYELLKLNVIDLQQPTLKRDICYCTRDLFDYFHYVCDGFKDIGWGCAYRSLQSVCSAYLYRRGDKNLHVPAILEIQQILVRLGDRNPDFLGSHEWIGALEVFFVFHTLYNVQCKILHISQKQDLVQYFETLIDYFKDCGGLIMMGGDMDTSSKCIAGAKIDEEGTKLLIIDPHFVGEPKSVSTLIKKGYIRWQNTKDFVDSSFYNLCMPLYK